MIKTVLAPNAPWPTKEFEQAKVENGVFQHPAKARKIPAIFDKNFKDRIWKSSTPASSSESANPSSRQVAPKVSAEGKSGSKKDTPKFSNINPKQRSNATRQWNERKFIYGGKND